MRVEPFIDTFNIQLFGSFENSFQVVVSRKMPFKFGPSFNALLRVVLWYELLFVLEGNPGFLTFEKLHLSEEIIALQIASMSFPAR